MPQERKASANVDGLSSTRRCLRRVAFGCRLPIDWTCRIGPKHHRGGERITKPSVPGQFVITAICLCREFAIDSGRVHFVRWSAISFYSLRSREFQKARRFFGNTVWRAGLHIPRGATQGGCFYTQVSCREIGPGYSVAPWRPRGPASLSLRCRCCRRRPVWHGLRCRGPVVARAEPGSS